MDLKAITKQDAIKEIVAQLALSGHVSDVNTFINDILQREKLGSTGIGLKVAIPHARTEAISIFTVGIGISQKGVDFDSLDGEKVNIIFLMGANPSDLNFYLRFLAELSRLFLKSNFRKDILQLKTPQEVINILKNYEMAITK